MASMCLFAGPILGYKRSLTSISSFDTQKRLHSSTSTSIAVTAVEPVVRRLANYDPTLWSFDHIQSLSSNYTGEDHVTRANALKETVKMIIRRQMGNLSTTLEIIDDLQRLGIGYHFKDEIHDMLKMIYDHNKNDAKWDAMDLNLKALGFRILRQHGYQVPQGTKG
ncbi:hypothetical protein E3N88_28178 [Mikania micrantha]|uniref:Terpene synthase N-terminal domain-containing protein n=1 Tax=Mikania micrantha TaxID=192012 RepID=A0A5N6MZY5_9ASTR|nr:hypothetical protein E3N88_28178 [Mikania micrantha]